MTAAFGPDSPMVQELNQALKAQGVDIEAIRETVTFLAKAQDAPKPEPLEVEEKIGPYELLEPLGEGGMGTVYLARQTHPVQRQVAIKFLKLTGDDSESTQLLESEMQALAMMNHSCIAKVYDTGTTEKGQPYFVMELVKGEPIDSYCDRQRLNIKQRLRLFLRVCSGVYHAHQRGIIHRDIKPNNVLISTEEGDAIPKIIDFGVAKGMDKKVPHLAADDHQVVGTPAYISPEQINRPQEVDTRSDVYALGVMLFELLVGALPYALKNATSVALLVTVLQGKTVASGERFSSLGDEAEKIAAQRRMRRSRLAKILGGDLSFILKKAMQRDKEDRYDSVAELRSDLERWLRSEVVLAHPASTGYRVRKFVRRHWLGTMAVSISTLSLIVGLGLATHGYVQAVRSREAVAREAEKSRVINAFLTDMLASADPEEQGRAVQVVDVLDIAAREIYERVGDQPEVEAHLRKTLGNTYNQLGQYDKAERESRKALQLFVDHLGREHPETLLARRLNAQVEKNLGEFQAAERDLVSVLQAQETALGPLNPETVLTRIHLASVRAGLGQQDQALSMLESLEHQLRDTGQTSTPNYLTVKNNLGNLLEESGEVERAAEIFEQALMLRRKHYGEEHPRTLTAMNNLALVYSKLGKLDRAEALHKECLDNRRRIYGEAHPATLKSKNNLALVYLRQGRGKESVALTQEVLDQRRKGLGMEHPDTLDSLRNLMVAHVVSRDFQQAEQTCQRLIDVYRGWKGPTHEETLYAMSQMGMLYQRQARYQDAYTINSKVLDLARKHLPADDPRRYLYESNVGHALMSQGRAKEACAYFEHAVEACERAFGADSRRSQTARKNLEAAREHVK